MQVNVYFEGFIRGKSPTINGNEKTLGKKIVFTISQLNFFPPKKRRIEFEDQYQLDKIFVTNIKYKYYKLNV